jgi:hypothetical protein
VASEVGVGLPDHHAPSTPPRHRAADLETDATDIEAPDSTDGSRAPVQRELPSVAPPQRARGWLPVAILAGIAALAAIAVPRTDAASVLSASRPTSFVPIAVRAPAAEPPAEVDDAPNPAASPARRIHVAPPNVASSSVPASPASASPAASASATPATNPLDRRK